MGWGNRGRNALAGGWEQAEQTLGGEVGESGRAGEVTGGVEVAHGL